MNKEGILREIHSINQNSELNKFGKKFDSCSIVLKELFINLVEEGIKYSDNDSGYVLDRENQGFRFAKIYPSGRKIQNYCMFTLQSRNDAIKVEIRTDKTLIESQSLILINDGKSNTGGFEWHHFIIKNLSEVSEAVKLIEYAYKI